jgi:putative spermidine/putrescine transport system permease protein
MVGTARLSARGVAAWLHRHARARLALLLTLPLAWLLLVYLLPLGLLLLTALWQADSFTGAVVRNLTTRNLSDVFTNPAYLAVVGRTVLAAALVTALCALLAVPMALFMALVAAPRWRPLLLALVLTPLWASYLVKVYAWRSMLSPSGLIAAALHATPGYGWAGVVLVLTYLWLPYMVLPVYTGLTAMRASLLDAAGDLGARPWPAVRTVVLPLLAPSIAAGSIFTFSLSLGDYVTVQLVGGTAQTLGSVVYQNFSIDLPFAAAVAVLPVAVMLGYLAAIRRTGALASL